MRKNSVHRFRARSLRVSPTGVTSLGDVRSDSGAAHACSRAVLVELPSNGCLAAVIYDYCDCGLRRLGPRARNWLSALDEPGVYAVLFTYACILRVCLNGINACV